MYVFYSYAFYYSLMMSFLIDSITFGSRPLQIRLFPYYRFTGIHIVIIKYLYWICWSLPNYLAPENTYFECSVFVSLVPVCMFFIQTWWVCWLLPTDPAYHNPNGFELHIFVCVDLPHNCFVCRYQIVLLKIICIVMSFYKYSLYIVCY